MENCVCEGGGVFVHHKKRACVYVWVLMFVDSTVNANGIKRSNNNIDSLQEGFSCKGV